MQAKQKRSLKSGFEYDKYFQKQDLKRTDPILIKHGDTFDTIDQMEKIVKRTLHQTEKIAQVLQGANLNQTCSNIYHFIYQHVQYTLDKPGVEQLREPLRSWADRVAGVDCDCYSIFISSILSNLGIEHAFRKTKYGGDYQHIYVVVPKRSGLIGNLNTRENYYVIDPVVDSYNYEVPFTSKHDKRMTPIQLLNGVEPVEAIKPLTFGTEFIGWGHSTISGLGAVQTTEQLAQDLLDRMKAHLVNTRNLLRPNPSIMPNGKEFLAQINAVIAVWENPEQRTAMLDHFAALEAQGIAGLGTLGGLWDSIKKATSWVGDKVSDGVKAVGTGIKNAGDWIGDKAEDAWDKVKDVGQDIIDAVVKYNPISVLIRNGLLTAFNINLFSMSERLALGYLTEAQAKAYGLNMVEWQKVKGKLDRVISIHKGLQGDLNMLRHNIISGWRKGTGKEFPNLSGAPLGSLGAEPVSITAASSVIATIVAFLKDLDYKKLFETAQPIVQNLLAPKSTDYSQFNNVTPNNVPPTDTAYLANQQKYDNPEPSGDNTMLIVAGVGIAAFFLLKAPDHG